jgi:mRNA interferase MazF
MSALSRDPRCAMPPAEARRSDVWLVAFAEPVGREQSGQRPALVVSTDLLNEGPSGVVIVVPMTTSRRGLPTHVEVDTGSSGLDDVSYAKCEDVKSISIEGLIARLGSAGTDVMFDVTRNLRFLLDI